MIRFVFCAGMLALTGCSQLTEVCKTALPLSNIGLAIPGVGVPVGAGVTAICIGNELVLDAQKPPPAPPQKDSRIVCEPYTPNDPNYCFHWRKDRRGAIWRYA